MFDANDADDFVLAELAVLKAFVAALPIVFALAPPFTPQVSSLLTSYITPEVASLFAPEIASFFTSFFLSCLASFLTPLAGVNSSTVLRCSVVSLMDDAIVRVGPAIVAIAPARVRALASGA
jgi:hypothetical protein